MINFVEMEKRQILNIVEPIMDNCLAGLNENNHAKQLEVQSKIFYKTRNDTVQSR